MKAASSIAKGKFLENYVVDRIIALGLDPKARRSAGSGNGNRDKADIVTSMQILGQNIGIEAKNHATLHIPEWLKQVGKLESLGMEPVLAFKQQGESLEDTRVIIYLETFLNLIVASKGGATKDAWQTKRVRENLENAVNEALKYL